MLINNLDSWENTGYVWVEMCATKGLKTLTLFKDETMKIGTLLMGKAKTRNSMNVLTLFSFCNMEHYKF